MSNIRDIAIRTAKQRSEQKHLPSRLWNAIVYGKRFPSAIQWNKTQLITQVYERNPAFYAAVNMIAQTVADIPIYVKAGNYGRQLRTESHPILQALGRNEAIEEYVERMIKYLITTGDAYAQIVKSDYDSKKLLGAICMPADKTRNIEGDFRKPILGFEYTGKTVEKFDFDEVIHICYPSLSNYFEGMSPAVPLAETIDLNNAAITWNKNTALDGGIPPVIAKAVNVTPTAVKDIKKMWRDQRGANSQHELTVTSDNLEFEKLNVSPHEAEWIEAVLQSMRTIFMCLGVSSSLMNDAGNKTYNNVHDARKALYTEGAIPIAKKFWNAHTRKLQGFYKDNPIICIDTDAIDVIQEDRKTKMERLVMSTNAGILTKNEARAELKYPLANDPNADVLQNTSIVNNLPRVDKPDDAEEKPIIPDGSI